MDVFVVERFLVGWSATEVDALIGRLEEAAPKLAQLGVSHVESIYIPDDETCLSLFVGPNADTVRSANEECDLPTGRTLGAIMHASRT